MDFTAILQGVNPILIFILLCFVGLILMFYRTMRSLEGLEHALARTSQELKERMRALEDRPVPTGASGARADVLEQMQSDMQELAAQQKRTAKGLRELADHAADGAPSQVSATLDRLVALEERNAAVIAGLAAGTVATPTTDQTPEPLRMEPGQEDEEELLEPVFDEDFVAGAGAEPEPEDESDFADEMADDFFGAIDEGVMSFPEGSETPEPPETTEEPESQDADTVAHDATELLEPPTVAPEGPDGFGMPEMTEEPASGDATPEPDVEDIGAVDEMLLDESFLEEEDEVEPDYEPTMEIDMSGQLPEIAKPTVPAPTGPPPAKASPAPTPPAKTQEEEVLPAEQADAEPTAAAPEPPLVDEEELDLDAFDLSPEELKAAGMEPETSSVGRGEDLDLDFDLDDDRETQAGPSVPPSARDASAMPEAGGLDFDLDLIEEEEPRKKGPVASKPQTQKPAAAKQQKEAGMSLPDLGEAEEAVELGEEEMTIEQAASAYAKETPPAEKKLRAGKKKGGTPPAAGAGGAAEEERVDAELDKAMADLTEPAAPGKATGKPEGSSSGRKETHTPPWEEEDTAVLLHEDSAGSTGTSVDLDETVAFDEDQFTLEQGTYNGAWQEEAAESSDVEFLLDDGEYEDDFDLSDAGTEDALNEVDFDQVEDDEADDDFELDLDDMSMDDNGVDQDAADYLERVIDFKELDSIQLEEMDADKD